MAIYVLIEKIGESDRSATYVFGPDENHLGKLELIKETGEVLLIVDVPGDKKGICFPCARRKLTLHRNQGQYPDRTCWAS